MALGQLVHDLFGDKGRVHVEGDEAPIAPKNRVPLQTHVEITLVCELQQRRLELDTVDQLTAESHFHTESFIDAARVHQRPWLGETTHSVDVHLPRVRERANRLQGFCGRAIGKQG